MAFVDDTVKDFVLHIYKPFNAVASLTFVYGIVQTPIMCNISQHGHSYKMFGGWYVLVKRNKLTCYSYTSYITHTVLYSTRIL